MRQLFDLLYSYRAFLLFILLEIVAIFLIVSRNSYQTATYISTSNKITGKVYESSNELTGFLSLRDANEQLMNENASLRRIINDLYRQTKIKPDSTLISTFDVIPGKVINNTYLYNENHITIDRGAAHGIEPGMGVISSNGIAGQIKTVATDYSTAYSLLHTSMMISAQIKKNRTLGTVQWLPPDYSSAQLKYVGKYVDISVGDTIVTSGFNAVYPPNISIGIVKSIENDPADPFLTVSVKLGVDFASLNQVYIVADKLRAIRDSVDAVLAEEVED
jgi:rod shape-determining protein MreC